MDDLVTWLLDQVAEDERLACAAEADEGDVGDWEAMFDVQTWPLRDFIKAHPPKRVLAECETKRRRIEHLTSAIADWRVGRHDSQDRETAIEDFSTALKLEAFAYAGRPGYREDWKP